MQVDEGQLLRTIARVVPTLRAEGIRFAVAGGSAVYAHGGPVTEHDVDIFLKPADVTAARNALVRQGMRASDPPEEWLTKVYDGPCLVDLIYRPIRGEITDATLDESQSRRIGPTEAPVVPATTLMADKLLVLSEHNCDFTPLLPIVRALREQVDWAAVTAETAVSAYARAFLQLAADLDIIDGHLSFALPHPGRSDAPAR